MTTETKKKPPVEKIQVGSVQASIWKREHEGKNFYTCSFQLSYKNGDKWETSTSYGSRDLINLVKAGLMAHSAIGKLLRADKSEDTSDEAGE